MKMLMLLCYVKLGWDDLVLCDYDCLLNVKGKCVVVMVGCYM